MFRLLKLAPVGATIACLASLLHALDVLQMSGGQQFSLIMQSGRVRFALLTGVNVFGETKAPADRALAISIQEVSPEET